MFGWVPIILATLLAIVAFAFGPSAFAYVMGGVVGGQIAGIGAVYKLFGKDPPPPTLLTFLEWTDPGVVAKLLELEPDDVAACIIARMQPRFAKKVMAAVSPLRQASLAYWLDHPQPFPRSEQQLVARRLKRALQRVS